MSEIHTQAHDAACPLDGRYGEVLRPFVMAMAAELHANAGKGDRPGWLAMTAETALLEIYYHLAKLQKAVRDDKGPCIQEHAADVANMSMMLLDICGGLALISHDASSSRDHRPDAFQSRVGGWMERCFDAARCYNMTERGDRFLEEVLELLQANGYDASRVPTLVDYVFGRPPGEPAQEVGGVMITLAAYCHVAGLEMEADGARELERISSPEVMDKIRRKQEAKNALHFDTPLPGAEGGQHGAG